MLAKLIPIQKMTDSQRLRSLITAALLRCIYASIEYAPQTDPEIRNAAINAVRDCFLLTPGYLFASV